MLYTLLYRLIPLIKRSKVPSYSLVTIAYLSFIIKAVAAKRVAQCPRMLPFLETEIDSSLYRNTFRVCLDPFRTS